MKTTALTTASFVVCVFCVGYCAATETAQIRCAASASDSNKPRLFATSELNAQGATLLQCGEEVVVVGRSYSHGTDSVRVRRQNGTEGYVLPEEIQLNSQAPASQEARPAAVSSEQAGSRSRKDTTGQQLVGVVVSCELGEKPNRFAAALRGAILGAASTPPPSAGEPSGAGDGISRAGQGTIAAQQAAAQMPYPKRVFAVYSFHSGYYLVSASSPGGKSPEIRIGQAVQFRVKNDRLFLTDDLGRTFKLRIVQVQRVSTPYLPAPGAGRTFSQPLEGNQ